MLLIACGGAAAGSSTLRDAVPVQNPLPTSLTTSVGTWAAVPMGHLDQPLNTFWQLFFIPTGATLWKNHAANLGMATNGGLLLASPASQSLLVAIRPSNYLKYSALVATTNGTTWAPAAPAAGFVDSLAVGPDHQQLALLKDVSGGRVLEAGSASSSWRGLVGARSLASSSAAHSCAPLVLSAVGFGPSADPIVGASCGRGGVVGLFADDSGAWRSIGPTLPASAGRAQVLSLDTTGGKLTALLALDGTSGMALESAWAEPAGGWQLSGVLSLGMTGKVVSIGPAPGGGQFVVYRVGKGKERLATIDGPGASWTRLPDLPGGTATVAFPGSGRVDALSVADTVMTDWVLSPGASTWVKHQVANVQILFGSSN